jgi:acetylornithine/succinyldiaminopimelate/putrescine aminotransferase
MNQKELFRNFLAQTSKNPMGIVVTKASGVVLSGEGDQSWIDLVSGIAVSNTGHGHPAVVKAVKDQAEKYMHVMVYGEMVLEPQVELAARTAALCGNDLDSVYFVNSGSEAVEGAVKLAKRYTGRHLTVSFRNAYHGSTAGALSLMGDERLKTQFRPLVPGNTIVPFNDISSLSFINSQTACVIVEPIQGEAGCIPAENEFLRKLRNRCDQTGTLLIFDEIQSGCGRTGKFFAWQDYGVVPDIVLLAKAYGGGMPLGAFVAPKRIMESLSHNPALGHITTFGGHPVSCAAALASIRVMEDEKLMDRVPEKNEMVRKAFAGNKDVQVRGKGLMLALETGDQKTAADWAQAAVRNGVITESFLFCETAIRIAPPLIISDQELQEACSRLNFALRSL